MKKSLVIALMGIACGTVQSFGQGTIILDNYNTGGPNVTLNGAGLTAGWTLGFYYVVGNATGSIAADPTGEEDPSVLGGGLVLATGTGSTAGFDTVFTGHTPGEALATTTFSVPGTSINGGDTITLEAVAYNGSSYTSSTLRGHSMAFTMPTTSNTSVTPSQIGAFMPGFVIPIPEPSTFALAALGAFALVCRHRRQRNCQAITPLSP